MKTTKQDHKKRALNTIELIVNNKHFTANWKATDLKTSWLYRSKLAGVTGYSAALKDAFINTLKP